MTSHFGWRIMGFFLNYPQINGVGKSAYVASSSAGMCSVNLIWSFSLLSQTLSQDHLIQIQPNFKGDLIDSVQVFIVDTAKFSDDYNEVSVENSHVLR